MPDVNDITAPEKIAINILVRIIILKNKVFEKIERS